VQTWCKSANLIHRKRCPARDLGEDYEEIGSWWNRRGDEIDPLALGSAGSLAVEIKNRDLNLIEAREILAGLEGKIPLVKSLQRPVTTGIAARTIDGAEALVVEGFYVRDLEGLRIRSSPYPEQNR